MSVVIDCPLCKKRALHINKVNNTDNDVRQCINCGYASNSKLKGTRDKNDSFLQFSEFVQKHSKEADGHIWFPSMINLPLGSLYPVEKDDTLKWSFVKIVDIPEDEQKNYPDKANPGTFLTKKLDFENEAIFDEYILALAKVRDEVKAVDG